MSCAYPVDTSNWRNPVYSALGRPISVPCNSCACCRADNVARWQARLNFEYLDKPSCFVTLTMDDFHLDYNRGYYAPTVKRETFHRFIDKLHHVCPDKFTYFACAEYGDERYRPHYHIVFFGLDFVKYYRFFSKYWKRGRVDVGPLLSGGIRYILKYLEKQKFDKAYNDSVYYDNGLDEPFLSMSPGIGSEVYLAHYDELRNGLPMVFGSRSIVAPTYYRRKFLRLCSDTVSSSIQYQLNILRKLRKEASRMNMSVTDYSSWKAKDRELKLVNRLRSKGIPVRERSIFGHKSYQVSCEDLDKYVDMCLEVA